MLYHIVAREAWAEASETGRLVADSLALEGFTHCSALHQVTRTATAHYRNVPGLVLLQIDPARLDAEVIWEDTGGSGEGFPHIYGSVPVSAVVATFDFNADAEGSFALPAGLT